MAQRVARHGATGAASPGSVAMRHGECTQCRRVRPGWVGPVGSDYAGSFFCRSCWASWEEKEEEAEPDQEESEAEELLSPSEAELVALLAAGGSGTESENQFRALADKLGSEQSAKKIRLELQRLSRARPSMLKTELKKHNFPYSIVPSVARERQALLAQLKDVLVWQQLPVGRLQQVCEARSVATTGKETHEDLMDALSKAAWEAMGIPIDDFPSFTVGFGVLEQVEALERKSRTDVSKALQSRCKGTPLEGEEMSKKTMLRLLRQIRVWENLTAEALQKLCEERSVGATDKSGKVTGLLECAGGQFLEEQDALVKRINERKKKRDLLAEVMRLEDLPLAALRNEFREHWGLPVEPGMDKEAILERVKMLLVWHFLPISELKKECQQRGVTVSGLGKGDAESDRQALVQGLTAAMCLSKWQALGIPAQRLGPLEASAEVVSKWEQLEWMSDLNLQQQCDELGVQLPREGLPPQQLKKCLQSAIVWFHLPFKELEADVQASGSAPERGRTRGEEELRQRLVRHLLAQLCAKLYYEARGVPAQRIGSIEAAERLLLQNQRLDGLDRDALMGEYQKFGLPQTAMSMPDLLVRVKDFFLWKELSAAELRKECQRRGVASATRVASRPEKLPVAKGFGKAAQAPADDEKQELLDRLLLHFCERHFSVKGLPPQQLGSIRTCERAAERFARLDGLSLAALASEHEEVGLPQPARAQRDDYIADLQQHVLWTEMPLCELRRVCNDGGVLCSVDPLWDPATVRRQLLDRLVAAKRQRHYEEHGVPARRLEPLVAEDLLKRFLALEGLGKTELVEECLKCGLPTPPGQLDRAQLLRKLKWAMATQELPFVELRKECVTLGIKGFHSAPESCREHMLEKMFWGLWDSAGNQPGANHCGRPPSLITQHLKTLQLPAGAGLEEVKRAYKRLALKHHPDKQLGEPQEDSSAAFLEISAAYEALLKHFQAVQC